MPEALRALLVEDSASDAGLVVRALEAGGYAVAHERVDSAAALREALAREPWDVVLCDYSLPGFGAPQALETLAEAAIEVPFIVVSGLIGEDNAIDLMRRGAADYVMKEGLQKLAQVVRREIADARQRAESRRAANDLARFQSRYVFAIDSAVDGFAALVSGARLVEANAALSRMAGRPREALVGMGLAELLAAVFPGGSITGAPKRRTAQIIEELEQRRRGLYCGAVVALMPGGLRCSIPIRTGELDEAGLTLQSGGGIVIDSDAEAERHETWAKVRAFDRG